MSPSVSKRFVSFDGVAFFVSKFTQMRNVGELKLLSYKQKKKKDFQEIFNNSEKNYL